MAPPDPTKLAIDPPATPPPVAAPVVDPLTKPTFEECIEERNRFHEDVMAGCFNGVNVPVNNYFAYYGGRIIDYDPDFQVLQHRAAAKAGVHWARLVIDYRGEPFVLT